LTPRPGRGFDALNRGVLAPLRSFMLHAPLANLLSEGKGWKLTTASRAICHLDADYHASYLTGVGCTIVDKASAPANPLFPYKIKEHERCEFNVN
jgi:hypothetical protein